MQKQAPTFGRLLVMVLFATSCFGLLLYLWLAFGGATPLKPKGYRVTADFPAAAMLAEQADIRAAGIMIGKVRELEVSPEGNRHRATLEIDRKYAPLPQGTRVTLRSKTLLGETYVELAFGSGDSPHVQDGGHLPNRNVQPTVQLDEILNSFDETTRLAFQTWQQSLSEAVKDRGPDLNDTFGTLPGFVEAGGDLLETLEGERAALKGTVRDTGAVFEAITRDEDQLANLIQNSNRVFTAIDNQRESFAEIWNIFPTFQQESRATFRRLERFAGDTRPLVRELRPALDDLGPTLENLGALSPDLRRLFRNLDPLITISRRSLPATAEVLDGLRPLLGSLGPWLSEVNPILAWLGEHSHTLSDIMANLGVATSARTESRSGASTGHYLRQFGPTGAETLAVHPTRLSSNRGNTYYNPLALIGPRQGARGILPAYDCRNAGGGGTGAQQGEKGITDGPTGTPACIVQEPWPWRGRLRHFPHIEREDYAQGGSDRQLMQQQLQEGRRPPTR